MLVHLGALGSSRAVYAAACGVDEDAIASHWAQAHGNHKPPKVVAVDDAPVKANVIRAPELGDGVGKFPHLISTPGFDPAPYITAGAWVTRDPENGDYNLGIYRGMIKAPDRIGCATDVPTQHLAIQWDKARRIWPRRRTERGADPRGSGGDLRLHDPSQSRDRHRRHYPHRYS